MSAFRFALLTTLAAAAVASTSCAPERARAIREDKSLTLGYPGATYRPNGKIGVGATFGGLSDHKSTITPEAPAGMTLDAHQAAKRTVVTSETDINPFVQFFPWDTSAFYVGVGGSYQKAHVSYDELRGGENLDGATTSVEYQRSAMYVGVPVGWAWIWAPGASLTLDFGPKFLVSKSNAYTKDGSAGAVDVAQRDRNVKTIDKEGASQVILGNFLLGWSF
jgi:hypothetical protein